MGMSSRRVVLVAGSILLGVLSVIGIAGLIRGPGATTIEGQVVSVAPLDDGREVCVDRFDSSDVVCGNAFGSDASRLETVQEGDCAQITVNRGALTDFDPLVCPGS